MERFTFAIPKKRGRVDVKGQLTPGVDLGILNI